MEKLKRVFARAAKGEKSPSKFSVLRGASQGTAPTGQSASGPSPSTAQTSSSTPASALDVLHAWNDPAVDICFVHGLGGDRYNTWAAEGASAPWPKLLLPDRVERARVLTYGYAACNDTNAAESSTKVIDDAVRLLEALAENRRAANAISRPLILIAHGSGGFLCKKAVLLSRAHHDTDYRDVSESLLGVLFMGTPHGDSWIKQWADIPASVLGLPPAPKTSLLKALATDHRTLEALQKDFSSLLSELTGQGRCFNMVSFFEELPSGDPLVKISTAESVALQGSTALQLGGNHVDMARFGTTDDRGFKRLLGYLLRWTSSTRPHVPQHLTADQVRFVETLPGPELADFIADISTPMPGTVDWVLSHPNLLRWLEPDEPSFLHISGPPGSGKSVMSLFLQRQLYKRMPDSVFYVSLNRYRSANDIFTGFIRQQLRYRPELFAKIAEEGPRVHERIAEGSRFAYWSDDELERTFADLAVSILEPTIYIVDGWDDLNNLPAHILYSFQRIIDKGAAIKFLILTKQQPELQLSDSSFSKLDNRRLRIELGNESAHTQSIQSFVGEKVGELCTRRPDLKPHEAILLKTLTAADTDFQAEAYISSLKDKASNTYLLPKLTLDVLDLSPSPAQALAIVPELSGDVAMSCRTVLGWIAEEDEMAALTLLTWVYSATRPLSIQELTTAVSLRTAALLSDLVDVTTENLDDGGPTRRLLRQLSPFLRVVPHAEGDRVHLINRSFANFLFRALGTLALSPADRKAIEADPKAPVVSRMPDGHSIFLTQQCIRYLNLLSASNELDVFGGTKTAQSHMHALATCYQRHPLLKYCVESLAKHARCPSATGKAHLCRELHEFLFSDGGRLWEVMAWYLDHQSEPFPGRNPIQLAWSHGLYTTVQFLSWQRRLQQSPDSPPLSADPRWLGEDNSFITEPIGTITLDLAAITTQTLEAMKKDTTHIDKLTGANSGHGATLLHLIALSGGFSSFLRLSYKADGTTQVDNGEVDNEVCRALEHAATAGSTSIMRTLSERGQALDRAPGLWTAGHAAALAGRRNVLEYLTSKDFNWKRRCAGMTPFLVAALGGRLKCVQFFLDATQGAVGEEVIVEGPLSGCRALHLAAGIGSALVVRRLLVALGKETVDIADDAGRTALHHACLHGRAGVVRVLMEAGANPAVADASGLSPVGLLKSGKQEAIDYLAATGLNPDWHVLDQEERQTADTLLKMIRNVRFEA